MNRLIKSGVMIAALMITAPVLSYVLTPKPLAKSEQPDLEALIPKDFSGWKIDPSIIPVLPSPDQQQQLSETYDQLVNRTYVNDAGKRMMISIAYGSRQSQSTQAHRQEVCYAAQGFQIKNLQHVTENVAGSEITITRMMATAKQRIEPVTYWFTVGDRVVQSRIQRLMVQLQFGLSGTIPDGVLVRISSINPNEEVAFREHLDFINEMLETMPQSSRARFVGSSVH